MLKIPDDTFDRSRHRLYGRLPCGCRLCGCLCDEHGRFAAPHIYDQGAVTPIIPEDFRCRAHAVMWACTLVIREVAAHPSTA